MDCKLIGYVRVSTEEQDKSGLGQKAQHKAIGSYAAQAGCKLLETYEEVESGADNDRPELAKAIEHARFAGATLVIAKLDRLSRNAAFLMGLKDSGVRFVACDMPEADETMVGMMAVFAQRERKMISERTKAALAAYKADGGLLGAARPECRNLTDKARQKGAKAGSEKAAERAAWWNAYIRPRLVKMKAEGMSLNAIAKELNSQDVKTQRGKAWTHIQVRNILATPATV